MKRIATPMIGGVVTSAILELLIYPAIYVIWRKRSLIDADFAHYDERFRGGEAGVGARTFYFGAIFIIMSKKPFVHLTWAIFSNKPRRCVPV